MSTPLNPQQRKAVETTEGRVLVLAGAGSGKTSVLAHRIAHLLHKKTPPEAILGLTFTNKAAEEMRQRVGAIVGREQAKKVSLCTFHSFCMKVLRRDIHRLGYTKNFTLYDERDVRRLLNQLARQTLEHEGDLPSLEQTQAFISAAKNRGSGIEKADPLTRDLFDKLYVSMRAYNAVDFDSLLSLTAQLFEEYPDALAHYQKRYKYVMIDEYQDTNPIQYKIAKMLSSAHNNLCVVGDDDQSIYGWRGADIKNILQFESTTIVKLEQNYRSTPVILAAANGLIRHNAERHEKTLWSARQSGDPILLFHAPTDVDEAQSVVQRIIWYRNSYKLAWKEIAILYRSNILARPLETALLQAAWEDQGQWRRGIPYEVFGGLELFERSEVKDLVAYLKAIANPLDQTAMLRIINVPRRGISDAALDKITQVSRLKNVPLWTLLKDPSLVENLSDRALNGLCSFVALIEEAQEKFSKPPLHPTLKWLMEKIDYKKAIQEEVKSDKMRTFKWENIEECIATLAHYDESHSDASLQDFLAETMLDQTDRPELRQKTPEDRVHLMTFHGAKGLEFEACFLIGLEDHIIPLEKELASLQPMVGREQYFGKAKEDGFLAGDAELYAIAHQYQIKIFVVQEEREIKCFDGGDNGRIYLEDGAHYQWRRPRS